MKFVCVDCDGVLIDFCGGIQQYLSDRNVEFKPENLISYSFKGDIGCDRSEVFRAIKDENLYPYLKAYDDITTGLLMLACSDVEAKAYTGSIDNPKALDIRTEFIKKHNMDGGAIYIGKKPVILDADALFDDNLDVHRDWVEAGYTGKLFLIDHNYNSEENNPDYPYFDKLIRCSDFNNAVERYLGYV